VNGSAQELMKDVPSCDKPGVGAWSQGTRDLRMGHLIYDQ